MSVTIKKDFRNTPRKPDLTTLVYGKVPPQAPEFEAAILGSCLNINGREIFEQVLGVIQSEGVFYVDAHQKIFAAMLRLYNAGTPIDLLLCTEELRKANELEIIGGSYFLTNLAKGATSDAHIEYHCRIVYEKFVSRECIVISGRAIGEAYEDATDVFALVNQANDEFYKLLSGSMSGEPKALSFGVAEVSERMEVLKESTTDTTGVPSNFSELDAITGGWQKTDLIILAARPSVGKTAFVLALAHNAADNMYPVLIFSLEMSMSQLTTRMIAAVSGIELKLLQKPKDMTPDEWRRYYEAAKTLSELPIYIDDNAGLNIIEVRAKSRKMKLKYGIELICIDYLQLMSGTGNDGNREQEISKISRELKKMAKDLEVPVIALSQLNRGLENQQGENTRDPRLSDLRESGAIEQDADNVIFLTNPSPKVIAENNFFMGKKMLIIAKGRNIGLGNIALDFNSSTQKFKDPMKTNPFKEDQLFNARAGMPTKIPSGFVPFPTESAETKQEPQNNFNRDEWENDNGATF